MPLIVKSFTISHDVGTTNLRNGIETDSTIHSVAGVRAEVMLLPRREWKDESLPDRAHASIVIEIDRAPNIPTGDFTGWLREQLLEMLQDDEDGNSGQQ